MDAKELIYRYDGDPSTEERVTDVTGEGTVPKVGQIIERQGKEWRVVEVPADYNRAVLLYRIFLIRTQA
jgi:hypothetical protein